MTEPIKKAVLIPCFNEELTIGKVIDDFRRELPEADIYVFNNNSTDGQCLKKKRLVINEKNRAAVTSWPHVLEREADIYILVDGDDTYPTESVHELLKPVIDKKADMSIKLTINQNQVHSNPSTCLETILFWDSSTIFSRVS